MARRQRPTCSRPPVIALAGMTVKIDANAEFKGRGLFAIRQIEGPWTGPGAEQNDVDSDSKTRIWVYTDSYLDWRTRHSGRSISRTMRCSGGTK
jgi:hypothetical protein